LTTLLVGLVPNVSKKLVEDVGEATWPGYAKDLRTDPIEPDCVLEDLNAQLSECPTTAPDPEPDPANQGNPFEDEPPDEGNPFEDDPPDEGNPFEDDPPDEGNPFEDDPPDEGNPFEDGSPDEGNPFEDAKPAKPQVNCAALQSLRDRCATRWDNYEDRSARLTPGVKRFRSVELAISALAKFHYWRQLLVLMVGLGALVTTLHREHIALRTPKNLLEHRFRQSAELLAHLLLLSSQVADWRVAQQSTAEVENETLPYIWGATFLALAAINVFHLVRPPRFSGETGTNALRMAMVIPLYVFMALLSAAYFLLIEGHTSGQAIYLHKFVQHPQIYLGIGLYIWGGMILARTRIAPLTFDILKPLQLPPAILAWLVVVLAAFPTAYSGASGIFVIAAGAVIFERLREAGAPKRLALAATAMSGSLGVVLRPCLVVVLISVLNKQVTTDELFANGLYVFLLTCVLFLLAMLWMNKDGFKMAPAGEAFPAAFQAFGKVVPFIIIGLLMIAGFGYGLETWLNEHSAPFIIPVTMLVLIAYDRFAIKTAKVSLPADDPAAKPLLPSLLSATEESSHHLGALLMLMSCSVAIGGMVERSDAMYLVVPETFGSPFIAMAFLVFVMVLVGMTMDALGAVILVSFTVAEIAYANGIDAVHFWMMVLVAFELGYLTPPVSLNHLLARQVIGPESYVENDPVPGGGFYAQYEHIIVPMVVMGTALVLVAFVPLFFY
jgi:TRAP-type C4-dicarboxylate transport system permease large subunit